MSELSVPLLSFRNICLAAAESTMKIVPVCGAALVLRNHAETFVATDWWVFEKLQELQPAVDGMLELLFALHGELGHALGPDGDDLMKEKFNRISDVLRLIHVATMAFYGVEA